MSLASKLKGSIGAVLFGFILIIGAIIGTWWNEGRTIKTHQGLEAGAQNVYSSTTIDYVSPENEDKLIHLAGGVTTLEELEDSDFGLKIPHLRLKRKVEMFQWEENKDTKINENTEEKITTYSYTKVWSEKVKNSQKFNESVAHQNPTGKKFESFSKSASHVSLGAHLLTSNQITRLSNWANLKFNEITPVENSKISNSEGKPTEIYVGKTSLSSPEIGDLRISYKAVYEGDYSIIARQVGQSFEPFTTQRGTTINLVKTGIHSAESMFNEEISQNNFIKWLLRGGGFVLLFIGIRMLFSIITALTNYVPILRSIVNFGISLFSGVVAFCIFFIVAGLAWVFYRPVIGVTLLIIGIGTFIFFSLKGKKLTAKVTESMKG